MWLTRKLSRRAYTIFAVLVLLGVFAAGSGWSADQGEKPGDPKNGRDLFISKGCMKCHSIWGESKDKKGPNLARVGMGRNVYDLCASVWSHWSEMNAVLTKGKVVRIPLNGGEIKDIIAYLSYLNYYGARGDAETGERVFAEKKCIQCHANDPLDTKERPGRSVFEMQEFQDPTTLAVGVWNHGSGMVKTMSERHVDWPVFNGEEVGDLVDYIRSETFRAGEKRIELLGNPRDGEKLFSSKACARCHLPEAGRSRPAVDLTSTEGTLSLNTIVANLWNHYPKISDGFARSGIPYPKINNEEMEHLLAYVYWMKTYGLKGNARAGQELYQAKKCVTCHTPSEQNDINAPQLVGSDTAQSPYSLLAAIWNHGPRMETLLKEKSITWPSLTGNEMRDMVAYFQEGKPAE